MRADLKSTQPLPAVESIADIYASDPEGIYSHRARPSMADREARARAGLARRKAAQAAGTMINVDELE